MYESFLKFFSEQSIGSILRLPTGFVAVKCPVQGFSESSFLCSSQLLSSSRGGDMWKWSTWMNLVLYSQRGSKPWPGCGLHVRVSTKLHQLQQRPPEPTLMAIAMKQIWQLLSKPVQLMPMLKLLITANQCQLCQLFTTYCCCPQFHCI